MTLPFVSLRAFEAVVRLRGFGRAAEELGVTQSAVSQHVKSLEEWTGCQLLVRGPRETRATGEGERLSDAVRLGLGQIEDVCRDLKASKSQRRTLVIACPPGFAINWLFPRLLYFDQSHQDIPVSIATQTALPDFVAGEIDAAIQYGPAPLAGLRSVRLMGERVFPVCSPDLLGGRAVADLSKVTLLVDELSQSSGRQPTWDFWAESVGANLPVYPRTRRFGQSNLVVQAALQGLGVALGREPLVIEQLVNGTLVRPFEGVAVSDYSYWLVMPKHKTLPAPLEAFANWLQYEAEHQPELPERGQPRGEAHVSMD